MTTNGSPSGFLPIGKDLRRDLNQQPTDNRIRDRDFLNLGALQLGEEVLRIHGFFSSHSFWKAGSARNGSHSGSSLKSAGVTGAL